MNATTSTEPDLSLVKARQQQTWASGDYTAIACRIALASWTPDGFIGQMFRIVSQYVAPPPAVASPLLWGTEEHLTELFGDHTVAATSTERPYTFRFTSADDYVAYFRRWYGPTLK